MTGLQECGDALLTTAANADAIARPLVSTRSRIARHRNHAADQRIEVEANAVAAKLHVRLQRAHFAFAQHDAGIQIEQRTWCDLEATQRRQAIVALRDGRTGERENNSEQILLHAVMLAVR